MRLPMTYVDPRVERQRWQIERADVEARWLGAVLARLAKGAAITSELAGVAEVKPGQEYSRFLLMLKRRKDKLCTAGQRPGSTGHANNVWRLVASS